jgi:hypothetical protein
MTMSYGVYDFTESLNRAGIKEHAVKRAIAAWGRSTEGWGEWEGGFIVELKDGRFAYIWGWCDTSGWGCQDGASVEYSDTEFDRTVLRGIPQHFGGYIEMLGGSPESKWQVDWDEDPADLNRYLNGEIDKW